MTDVNPNRCGEPVNRPEGTLTLQDREEVSAELFRFFLTFSSLHI
jgi:hypothetical protein